MPSLISFVRLYTLLTLFIWIVLQIKLQLMSMCSHISTHRESKHGNAK